MPEYRRGPHTVYDIQYHLVWTTKYRYRILTGEIGIRLRDLIRQICMTREVVILKGHVSADHVHLLVSAPPHIAVSNMVQSLKGKSSRVLQMDYPSLRKKYWGRHLWARGFFCATVGAVTDKMVKAYIDQQQLPRSDSFGVEGSDDAALGGKSR
jgi:putative transposase